MSLQSNALNRITGFENLYVHIPFCRVKCGYCAFYSESGREDEIDRYLDKIESVLASTDFSGVESVYVGGGTPTLLDCGQLERLIGMLPEGKITIERTIESNPETLTVEKVKLLASYFNRISTGVQSFDAKRRRLLGRESSDKAILNALELIAEANFTHRNIDLIYAVGNQSCREWEMDLQMALAYPIDHLSCYALTFEENCRLDKSLKPDRFGETEEALAKLTVEYTQKRLDRYEISNYASCNGECKHNLNVWRGRSYLGVGASASSFDGVRRFTQIADINSYIRGTPPEFDELPEIERELEIFVFNLRTVTGWSRLEWEERGGNWQLMMGRVLRSCQQYPDFWSITADTAKLTTMGLDFWDTVAEELLFL